MNISINTLHKGDDDDDDDNDNNDNNNSRFGGRATDLHFFIMSLL